MAKRPHRQARALTWPTLTVFPFIACPDEHLLLKPNELVQGSAEYPG
ncbi:MAG TPA: hypothetical protein VG269_13805 [Tepidisphaeraceae bacterium]|nr:hypothetical protein [Tepidisphaeraceae bacterium]